MSSSQPMPSNLMAAFLQTPGNEKLAPLVKQYSCIYSCKNGGTCMEGVCQCPGGFEGEFCETDVLLRNVVIGSLIAAVCVCSFAIIAFLIYQRRQDANPLPPHRRVRSVRNRHLSKKDRNTALADVEIPPAYDEAVTYEQDSSCSTPSKNCNNHTKSEIVDERADQASQSQTATSNDRKVKPSMSFASRLLERALVGKRQRNSEVQARQSPHRSNSAPTMSVKHRPDSKPGPSKKQAKTKRIQGPTRAISVPGKVVQVTME